MHTEVLVRGLRRCGGLGGPGLSVVWKLGVLLVLVMQIRLWGLSSGGGGGGGGYGGFSSSWEAAQAMRQVVDRRLQSLEQRVESAVSRAMAGKGPLVERGEAKTDVSAMLRQVAVDSPEARELRKLQYCDKYRASIAKEAAAAEAVVPVMEPWVPSPGKFLFPLCMNGRDSNRMLCMQTYVLLAALLNRTLVVPEKEPGPLGLEWRLLFDVHHARRCIGDAANTTIITLAEYRERTGTVAAVQVQRVMHFKRYSAATARRLWPAAAEALVVVPERGENVRSKVHSMADFFAVFGAVQESLVSLGDLFWMVPFPGTPLRLWAEEDGFWTGAFPDMPPEWTARPERPPLRGLACTLLVQPHAAILEAAKGMVSTVLGADGFVAVHWRRTDFLQFWNDADCRESGAARQLCRINSVAATARCVLEKLAGLNAGADDEGSRIRVVYAATDARPAELGALERMLAPAGLVVITNPSAFAVRWTWAERWVVDKLGDSPLAVAMLDKAICAMSSVFMGTLHSTFTQDIVFMRAALGTLSCEDQDLCRRFPHSPKPLPFFNDTDFFGRPF